MNMTLNIGRRFSATVDSFEAASKLYAAKRNASGQGGSKWPIGEIVQNDKTIARVSYNSKIWPAEEWTTEQKPLFVPACCHCGGTPCCCGCKVRKPDDILAAQREARRKHLAKHPLETTYGDIFAELEERKAARARRRLR